MTAQEPASIAIVGAGLSGMTCAAELQAAGFRVVVFEKSRGVGGRMSSRLADYDDRSLAGFDHGAQYFTTRDARFAQQVRQWVDAGAVAEWRGTIAVANAGVIQFKEDKKQRYVGVPDMREPCQRLGERVDVRFHTRVGKIEPAAVGWAMTDDAGQPLGEFEAVAVSAPAPQAAELLAAAPKLKQQAESVVMGGCWAAMVAFEGSLDAPFDGAFVHESPLSWVARNASKPGRTDRLEPWVLHASPEWTDANLEASPEAVLPDLLAAFWRATGLTPREPAHAAAHRWRYALPTEPLETRSLFDANLRIGACGDWCGGPRVEGAYLSGFELAGRLREALA